MAEARTHKAVRVQLLVVLLLRWRHPPSKAGSLPLHKPKLSLGILSAPLNRWLAVKWSPWRSCTMLMARRIAVTAHLGNLFKRLPPGRCNRTVIYFLQELSSYSTSPAKTLPQCIHSPAWVLTETLNCCWFLLVHAIYFKCFWPSFLIFTMSREPGSLLLHMLLFNSTTVEQKILWNLCQSSNTCICFQILYVGELTPCQESYIRLTLTVGS